MRRPLVQIAIDAISLDTARSMAGIAQRAGADWIEIGKPLIEYEGINGVAELVSELGSTYVLLDLMIMAAPEKYIRAAREIGAQNVMVTALAPFETVAAAITFGKQLGVDVTVDLFNTPDTLTLARRFSDLGADYLMVHFGVDQKRSRPAGSPVELLRQVVEAVDVPVSYATYDLDESLAAVAAGASVIVQGEPLTSAPEPEEALRAFIAATTSHGTGAQL
jgi:3-hexulose-6-phosphate synthase